MRLKLLIIICPLIFSAGCQYDPFADDLATKQPRTKDLIGTYVFEKQTVTNSFSDKETNGSKIILKLYSNLIATNAAMVGELLKVSPVALFYLLAIILILT